MISFCYRGRVRLLKTTAAMLFGAAMMVSAQRASAMTFNATFATNGSAGAFSAQDIADINSLLSLYSTTFTDTITINVTFKNSSSGLGSNNPLFIQDNWASIQTRLIADATTADDTAAVAQLAARPITGTTLFDLSTSNAKALSYSGLSGSDDTINLNAGLCFNVHDAATATANPTKYDLFGVACHELNECLGSVSGVGGSTRWLADAYRYHSTGTALSGRSFTTSSSESAWFSIDGTNGLDQYNQSGTGDYGDWIHHSPAQVQDWSGTPGVLVDPNVELRLLDVVGYNRAVPEPATMAALGLGVVALIRRRRK